MTSYASADDLMVPADPLLARAAIERVNYATGVLLHADDFRDEQTYHRSRLAAALSYLVGHGTLAGLAVRAPAQDDGDLHLRVEPGVAIDRYGRLIEVEEPWCTRLERWYAAQDAGALRNAIHLSPNVSVPAAVVADLFLTLADCARGKTPSFAQGPFDALDALVPSRLAEQPQFELVLRAEGPTSAIPSPANFWHGDSANEEDKLADVLGSYAPGAAAGVDGGLAPFAEHVTGHDPGAVLLARVTIPVVVDPGTDPTMPPQRDPAERIQVDNRVRPFIHLPGKWLGATPRPVPTHEP